MSDPTVTPTPTETRQDAVAVAQRLDVLSYDLMVGGQDNAYRSTLALSGIPVMRTAANLLRDLTAVSAATPDERPEEPVSASFGHGCITLTWYPSSQRVGVVHHGQNAVMDEWEFVDFARQMAALAARPAPTVNAVWVEGIPNDGEWEYTATSNCDGSNVQFHRRRPAMASPVGPWEPASEKAWADALNATLGLTVADEGRAEA